MGLLIQLIRYYREKSYELIVDGKATKFKVLKIISSTHLAI